MVAGRNGRGTARARQRARANELVGLGTPAATNLKHKDNKSAPLRAHQLSVGAFLSAACQAKSGALLQYLRWCRRAAPLASRGETKVVSTTSCTSPKSGSPFAMTSMRRSSRRSGWMLRSRTRTLQATVAPASRQPTGAQDTRRGASSAWYAVVTERVDRTAAATSCSVERQGQAKPAEQQSAENRRVQGEFVAGRQGGEDPRGERSTLRLKQGQRKRVKHCAEAAGGAIIDSTGSGPLPASSSVGRLVGVCRDNGRLQGQVGEGRRWEASVAEKVDSTGEGAQAAGQGRARCCIIKQASDDVRSQAHGVGVPQASQPRRRSRLLARAQPHCGDQVRHGAGTSWRAAADWGRGSASPGTM